MTCDELFAEWRRLDKIARISGKKGDYEKADVAHKAWKSALAKGAA
jgi:hypothetical protein